MRTVLLVGAILSMMLSGVYAQDTLKIGVISPITGPLAELGTHFFSGIKAEARRINENGGIAGKKIQLISMDSSCEPSRANAVAQRLALVEAVHATIERACSGTAATTSQIFQELDIPHIIFTQSTAQAEEIRATASKIEADEKVTMINMAAALERSNTPVSLNSAAGFSAMEMLGQAFLSAGSDEPKRVKEQLYMNPIETETGRVVFSGENQSNTLIFDLWSEKKDCPKCPKSGACPQSITKMVAKKKICN